MRTRWLAVLALAFLVAAAATFAWTYHPTPRFNMVATLKAIADKEAPWDNPWDLQELKIAALQLELKTEPDAIKRLITKREIAQQYVNEGNAEPGIALLEQTLQDYRDRLGPSDIQTLKADIAFAYFRIGEQQNCTLNHNSDVCIFPVKDGGVHKSTLGASSAATRYEELLQEEKPDSDNALVYRWMLNICYMQLGKYPGEVPKKWLIPQSTFDSDYDIGLFHDVAASRGIVEQGRAGGAILEDFDNDGHLDLMISHMGVGDQMEYFHNNGNGTFTRMTHEAGLTGLLGGLNLIQLDYNNDGCVDVFVPRGAWYHDKGQLPSSLLRNNCDGTFTDVTAQAGLLNNLPTQTAVSADFNNDGFVDIFVGNEIVRDQVSWPDDTKNFRLYINNGNGTFTDFGAQSGIALNGMIKGATADDFDNDGWQDLYVSVMGGPNHLYRSVGSPGKIPKFIDVTARAGVAQPTMSFTTWFFDYDNDGWPDIFVSGYSATMPNIIREFLGDKAGAKGDRPRLYHNNRNGTFTDVSRAVHLDRLLLTMGANFGDLDNDGWLDIYLGTGAAPLDYVVPNQMFRNAEGHVFQNVTTSGGFGHLQKGHAVAFGDIDNDGNQDVFENVGGAMVGDKFYSALYKNPGHGNHWLKLDLTGVRANRMGVGARIHIHATDPSGRPLDFFRTVSGGGSFGASSLRPHIGLGRASAVDSIEIRWPGSGTLQKFAGPFPADARYEIREDRAKLAKISEAALAGN